MKFTKQTQIKSSINPVQFTEIKGKAEQKGNKDLPESLDYLNQENPFSPFLCLQTNH